MSSAFTIWCTGLPSSGKTEVAALVGSALKQRGISVEVLDCDGDAPEAVGHVARAQQLNGDGVVAVLAPSSPFREEREGQCGVLADCILVHPHP